MAAEKQAKCLSTQIRTTAQIRDITPVKLLERTSRLVRLGSEEMSDNPPLKLLKDNNTRCRFGQPAKDGRAPAVRSKQLLNSTQHLTSGRD